ncbi:MAG: hypothetical protein LBT95_00540 [Treponema sp.]|jgi:hypothetical protein|nr:hypothetical protein [Treponema sp.]
MRNSPYEIKRGLFWHCFVFLSVLGLFLCVPLLFPGIREIIIDLSESFVFHRELEARHVAAAREALAAFGIFGLCFILFFDFWALTVPGRTILEKTGFIDIREKDILDAGKSLVKKTAGKPFELFGLLSGSFVLMAALSRAANTGMTRDEATMCFDVVFPGIVESLMRSQYLNNHMLDAFLIRITLLITQAKFNEFFIRLPSLIFYGAYIFFAYKTAKQKTHPYLVFILFISNYYLNEFSGLARGYGMAAACMAGAFYFFNRWKDDANNKKLFRRFMLWCALGVLANGITLYTVFCLLMVVTVKYRKNIIKLSNLPWFLIFLFVSLYLVFVSRPTMPGKPIATTRSFYSSIVAAVFDTFSLSNRFLTLALFIIFIGMLIYLMIKTRGKNDYGWMYIIFICLSLISNIFFGRGYPLSREMLPFYPVIVFVAADGLEYIKPRTITRPLFVLAGLLLCFQFIIQIDTKGTRDWREDYSRKNEILQFIGTNRLEAESGEIVRESLKRYIETNPSSVGMFYMQKLTLILDE